MIYFNWIAVVLVEEEGNENLLAHSHRNNDPSSLFVKGTSQDTISWKANAAQGMSWFEKDQAWS